MLAALMVALVSMLAFGVPAQAKPAGPAISTAASNLRSDPIWVDPAVPKDMKLTETQADNLRSMIENGRHHDVFVAVLPASVGKEVGSADQLEPAVEKATGKPGVYAVAAPGPVFRAGGTSKASVTNVKPIGEAAWAQKSSGLYAVLKKFVKDVEDAPVAGTTTQTQTKKTTHTTRTRTSAASHKDSGSLAWLWWALGILAALVLLAVVFAMIRNRTGLKGRKRTLLHELDRLATRASDNVLHGDDSGLMLGDIESLRQQLADASTKGEVDAVEREIGQLKQPQHATSTSSGRSSTTTTGGGYGDGEDDETFGDSVEPAPRPAPRSPTPRGGGTTRSQTGSRRTRTHGPTIVNNYNGGQMGYDGPAWQGYYPGYDYGYWPGYGWGYWSGMGASGGFVAGLLVAELLDDDRHSYDSWAGDHGYPVYDDAVSQTVTEETETVTTYGEDPDSVDEAAEEVGGGGEFAADTGDSDSDSDADTDDPGETDTDSGGWAGGGEPDDASYGGDFTDNEGDSAEDGGFGPSDGEDDGDDEPDDGDVETDSGGDDFGGGDFGDDGGGWSDDN